MKPRITLTLAAIAGTLFAYIWFVDRHENSTREEAEVSAKVIQIDRQKVSKILIKTTAGPLELARLNGVWNVKQPVEDRADTSAVEQLLSLLENLRHDSKITLSPTQGSAKANSEKVAEQLKEYGLGESELSLKLVLENGGETELLFGKESAIEGKLYTRVNGQNTVYVIRDSLRTQITRKPDDFRDHKLTAIPPQSVQVLNVKTAEGELEMERKSGHWNITKPMRARGADSKINDLLASVLNANMSQFLPATPSPEQGLSEPRATLSFKVEGEKDPVLLQIGAPSTAEPGKETSFAKLSSRATVTVLPNSSFDPLLKARPNDLRDRKLLRIEPDIVDRITLEPARKTAMTLSRKAEAWVQQSNKIETPVREGLATKILSDLQAAEAVNFVADVATDLEQYGLAHPQYTLRLSSFASGNTAETQAGEKPILNVLFGSVGGDSGYVKLDDEPFIVAIPKSLLNSLPTEPLDLLPSPPEEPVVQVKKEDISKVSTKFSRLSTSVEKDGTAWKMTSNAAEKSDSAPSSKPDTTQVIALIDQLVDLRAGLLKGEHPSLTEAMKVPVIEITLETRTDTNTTQTVLTIGQPVKDGSFPATVTGKEGVFLLAQSKENALENTITALQAISNQTEQSKSQPEPAVSLPPPDSTRPATPRPQ